MGVAQLLFQNNISNLMYLLVYIFYLLYVHTLLSQENLAVFRRPQHIESHFYYAAHAQSS